MRATIEQLIADLYSDNLHLRAQRDALHKRCNQLLEENRQLRAQADRDRSASPNGGDSTLPDPDHYGLDRPRKGGAA